MMHFIENIKEFFEKEYLWIISIGFAILAMIQSYRIQKINKRNSRRRNLSLYYKIRSNFSLDKIPEKLTINYENMQFSNIAFAEFIFGNNGNVVLTKNDFFDKIVVTPQTPIRIISIKTIAISNDGLKIMLYSLSNDKTDFIEIQFPKLSPKQSMKFQMVYAPEETTSDFSLQFDYTNESSLDEKVVRDVSFFDNPNYRGSDSGGLGFGIFVVYIAFVYFSFIYTQEFLEKFLIEWLSFRQASSEIISFFFSILPAAIVTFLLYLAIKHNIFGLGDMGEEKQSPFGKNFEIGS